MSHNKVISFMLNGKMIYRDYHMTVFISDPLSTLGSYISARESEGSRTNEGSDMKMPM